MKRLSILVTLIIVVICMSTSMVHAQAPSATIDNVRYDISKDPIICVEFDLDIYDAKGDDVGIRAYAYYDATDEQIENISGIDADRTSDGYMATHEDYTLTSSHASFNDMSLCMNTNGFPMYSDDFDYYVIVGVYENDQNEVIENFNISRITGKVLTNKGHGRHAIRISNIVTDPNAYQEGENGVTVEISLNVLGYEDQELTVVFLPTDSNGDLLNGRDNAYTTSKGILYTSATVKPGYLSSWWIAGDPDHFIRLFIPYEAFPSARKGDYEWYPDIRIYSEDGDLLYSADLSEDSSQWIQMSTTNA